MKNDTTKITLTKDEARIIKRALAQYSKTVMMTDIDEAILADNTYIKIYAAA